VDLTNQEYWTMWAKTQDNESIRNEINDQQESLDSCQDDSEIRNHQEIIAILLRMVM
jgi:hypothetical protein